MPGTFPDPESLYRSDLADVKNSYNYTGFKDKRADEILTAYNQEFDQQKRVALIRELDGIVANLYPSILEWQAPFDRIAYQNKFGHPESYFPRIGDHYEMMKYWWIDPDLERRHAEAEKNPTIKMDVGPLEVRYWEEYAKTDRRDGGAAKVGDRIFRSAISAHYSYVPRNHAGSLRHHPLRAWRSGRTPDHANAGRRKRRGRRRRAAAARRSNCPRMPFEQIRQYYGFDKPVHVRYGQWLWNVVHLDLGNSYIYQDPVWDVIKSRFPVSLTLGLTGFLLSYLICVPLGVLKAVRHGSKFDLVSSVLVFMGYAVPGWALGTALLVLFGGGSFWNVFPLGGFRSDNWDYLSFGQKIVDQLWHMALPVACYMVGGFATLTILTKNSLMENMSQDYVRTAFAKGLDQAARDFRPCPAELAHSDRDRTRPCVQPDSGGFVSD